MNFRKFLKEGKEVEDEKELPTTKFEEDVLGLEKKFVSEEDEDGSIVEADEEEEDEEELKEGELNNAYNSIQKKLDVLVKAPDDEKSKLTAKELFLIRELIIKAEKATPVNEEEEIEEEVDEEKLEEGSRPPGIKAVPMTDDDLNPEGTPATEKPVDEEEEISESEEVDEDIKDAEIRDLSDEEVEELLDAIARTDAEKKEVVKNRDKFIKDLKKLGKDRTKEEILADIEKYDKDNKYYGAKDSESGKKSIADRMDKLMHRSVVTSVGGSKKGGDAKYLGSIGVKMDAGSKRLTTEQFKSLIKERPSAILGQNSKMFVSGGEKYNFVDISLPAYQGMIVDESNNKFKIIKTCPSAQECTVFCYASKSFYTMFPGVALKAARVLNYLWNDYNGFVSQIKRELKEAVGAEQGKKKGKKYDLVMRWHDAGDVISEGYLDMMIDVAKETEDIIHYAYTKQLDLIDKKEGIPENLKFTKSFGGKADAKIDVAKDKSAQVVPEKIFKDFLKNAEESEKKWRGKTVSVFKFRPEDLKIIKKGVADEFKLPEKDIITYDELMEIPYSVKDEKGERIKHEAKWHVLVFHGHGDDAGMRNDVKTVLLFEH